DAADEHDISAQPVAELRRQREPVLLVDRVLVGSVEHARGRGLSPTVPHLTPLSPTWQPLSPPSYGSGTTSAWTPDPAIAPDPQRAAKSRAASPSRTEPSPNASPAAKQSPAPSASAGFRGSGAALYGPPGCAQPPRAPDVVTTRRGSGSSCPVW